MMFLLIFKRFWVKIRPKHEPRHVCHLVKIRPQHESRHICHLEKNRPKHELSHVCHLVKIRPKHEPRHVCHLSSSFYVDAVRAVDGSLQDDKRD
jgi:hypothetical protein